MTEPDIYVYLIATKPGEHCEAPVKIGVSANPEARLANLQTACPYELTLMAKLSFPSRELAQSFEGCFHRMERSHRLRGEWFDIPPHKALGLLKIYARWAIDLLTHLPPDDKAAAIAYIEQHLEQPQDG